MSCNIKCRIYITLKYALFSDEKKEKSFVVNLFLLMEDEFARLIQPFPIKAQNLNLVIEKAKGEWTRCLVQGIRIYDNDKMQDYFILCLVRY